LQLNVKPENWLLSGPDLHNPVYYAAEALQPIIYRHKISDIDQFKRVQIDFRAQLSQNTLNRALYQLPKKINKGCQGEGCPCLISSELMVWWVAR